MGSIASQVPVLLAALDLAKVQGVIHAMKAADTEAALASKLPGPPNEVPLTQENAPPRPAAPQAPTRSSAPTVAPIVYQAAPHVEIKSAPPRLALEVAKQPASPSPGPEHQTFTLQPPWKVLPWPQHEEARVSHFKPRPAPPDILIKGLLIDIFV